MAMLWLLLYNKQVYNDFYKLNQHNYHFIIVLFHSIYKVAGFIKITLWHLLNYLL